MTADKPETGNARRDKPYGLLSMINRKSTPMRGASYFGARNVTP